MTDLGRTRTRFKMARMRPQTHNLAVVHRTIAVRHAIEVPHAIKNVTRLDAAFEHASGRSCSMQARIGAGPPALVAANC